MWHIGEKVNELSWAIQIGGFVYDAIFHVGVAFVKPEEVSVWFSTITHISNDMKPNLLQTACGFPHNRIQIRAC